MTGVHGILLAKTRRDLRRRLPQFIAIAITVMVGVLLFIASYDAFRNLDTSYKRSYERLDFADLTASGGDAQRTADAARKAPGVSAVANRTQQDLPVRLGKDKLLGRVVGMPATGQPPVNAVDLKSGEALSADAPDGVLLETHAADTFGLGPGDRLRAFDGHDWRTLTVRGVVVSPEYLWPARSRQEALSDPHSFAVVFAPEATARELAGPDAGLQTLVRMKDSASDDDLAKAADALRRAGATDVTEADDQASNAVLHEDLKGFQQLAVLFPMLFLTAAAIAAYVLITRLVLSERKVIATFLAAGAPRAVVVRHYLGHGLIAGTAGAVVGAGLGALATSGLTHAYTEGLSIPDTVVEGRPLTLVLGVLFGVVVGLAGGIAPALAASRAAPAEAMRGDGGTLKPPGPWSRAVARARRVPVIGRLALRELTRSKRRTVATMTGTLLALVVVLSSVGLLASMRSMMDTQFNEVQRQDATITAAPGAPDLTQALGAVDHVAEVERVTTAPVSVGADGRSYRTSLTGYRPDTRMHGFRSADGGSEKLPDQGILGGEPLADKLGVSVGDTVTVSSAGRSTEVRLVGLLDEPLGTAVYGTPETVRSLTGAEPGTYEVRFTPGTGTSARDQVRAEITGMTGVVAYADAQAVKRQFDSFLKLFWIFVGVMLALGAVLALTVIYVTMTVNVAERTSELATLSAAGVPLRRIAGILAVENLTATVIATPFGLLAGAGAAWASIQSFNSDMFSMELTMGWPSLLLAAVAVLGASLLSQIPAVRMVRSLDIARVVRERAQ